MGHSGRTHSSGTADALANTKAGLSGRQSTHLSFAASATRGIAPAAGDRERPLSAQTRADASRGRMLETSREQVSVSALPAGATPSDPDRMSVCPTRDRL